MRCSTNIRVPALQIWPELANTAIAAPGTAASISASEKTMSGDFPPSSSDTRFRLPADAFTIDCPVTCDPVNATLSTPGCAASAAPAVSPYPGTMLMTPGGTPASSASSPRRSDVSGASLGRLQHHRAPGRENRTDLPTVAARPFHRDDRADDADRFLERVGKDLAGERVRDRLAVDRRGLPGVVAQHARTRRPGPSRPAERRPCRACRAW
jgi:hypothetical protein